MSHRVSGVYRGATLDQVPERVEQRRLGYGKET
jgi:hypothetical protein